MNMRRPLPLQPKDLASDREVRWCPGCGDFSILAQLKKVLAGLGLPREQMVFLSGLGCAARMPHYLRTFGFQTLPGRALPVAIGLKQMRPDLQVWVVGGEGDLLHHGGHHLLHALRRNGDIKILLLNNEVLGQSRGQASLTTRPGTRTSSTPQGASNAPLRPLMLALAAEASFVARTVDVDIDHLAATLHRAARHRGCALVEIYQNCTIYNPDAFSYAADKAVRWDNVVYLEHGQPLRFGKDRDYGIRLVGLRPEVVMLGTVPEEMLLCHDETAEDPTLALMLARWTHSEEDDQPPEVLGVLRAVERPTHDETRPRGQREARLREWLYGDNSWTIPGEGEKVNHALPVL
jgi:2-oxoglutarate ferredoxin oxidoreductase subunit beta